RYHQLLQGRTPEPLVQEHIYREYIALEQKALVNADSKTHFTDMLAEAPIQQLPGNMSAEEQSKHSQHSVDAFSSRSKQLIELSGSLGVPLQAVLQTIHIKVLHFISGQKKVLTNVVHNGRPETEGGDAGIGLFLNSIPMVIEPKVGDWKSLIEQVIQVNNQTLPHRHYPLAQIAQDTGLSFDEVLFNYTHFHVFEQVDVNEDVEKMSLLASSEFEQTNFGLTVDTQRGGDDDSLGLSLRYDSSRFSYDFIKRMSNYFIQATDLLLSDVNANSYELSLLSEQERQLLLFDYNSTTNDYCSESNIHGLFETQVQQTPDAVALEFEDKRLSYAELNDKANALAGYLIEHYQLGQESLVGIYLERSIEMVVAVLATLKAGGAYVPLDPDYPQSRLNFMLEDASPHVVLSNNGLASKLSGVKTVCLDDEQLNSDLHQKNNCILPSVAANQLAYVIYTSGSTGQPKGVMVEHQALVNRISWMEREYVTQPGDKVLQKTPFSFDVSVWELMWPLVKGATLVMTRPGGHKEPEYLVNTIRFHKITRIHFVPSMLSSLLAQQDLSDCHSLRQVFCSGEALGQKLAISFIEQYPHIALHNLYGPTEAAIDVTYYHCQADLTESTSTPIGRPIDNTQLYVLGANKSLLPHGAAGELYIGGVGLARGYLGRPELTAERFIDNPYYQSEQGQSQRLYRTGDLVKWLPTGNLAYLGRLDQQVKVRGFRIEIGEVENAIATYEDVRDSVVVMSALPSGENGLVAYVVAPSITEETEESFCEGLRQHLLALLPEYMLPMVTMLLGALPLTANGKLDRRALPAVDVTAHLKQYVAPRTQTEEVLCRVWHEVLGVEPVGIYHNFFELGGHSLLAVNVISQIKGTMDADIQLRDFFNGATIAEIATQIDTQRLNKANMRSFDESMLEEGVF
ncbi:amino acid adenylation domain-containing protein, partial [Rheinheimera soli]